MFAAFLASILPGVALGKVRASARPNPYAPTLPDQGAHAAAQSIDYAGRLRAGLSGMSGSEADFYREELDNIAAPAPLRITQDLVSAQRPASTFAAGDPGADPNEPTVLRDFYRGPVGRYTNATPGGYAGSTRTINTPANRVLPWTINPPQQRTPTAKEMVGAELAAQRAAGVPAGDVDALAGLWSD